MPRHVAALMAVGMIAVACAPASAPRAASPATGAPAAATASAPLTATMAVANNLNHVVAFVGVEKGIFLKHGLDLKLKVLSTGAEINKALQAGEAQFGGASVTNTPLAREQGLPLISIVGWMNDATTAYSDDPLTITARKEAGIGAGELDRLVGKKVGLVIGGTGDEYLRLLMKKRGISADKVQFINVQPGNQIAAMQNGSVDVTATWEPYGVWILEKIPASTLVIRGGGHLGYVIMVSTTEDVLKNKREIARRFVLGTAEAAQYARQHLDEAAEIATRWIPGLDGDVARKGIKFMPYDPRITKYALQAYDESVKVLVDQKKLKSFINVSESIDASLIEQVMKDRPELFRDLKEVR